LSAAYRLELPLLARQRDPAATAGAGFSLRTDKLVPHRWSVVIYGAGVALEVEAWRRRSRRHTLAQEKICAAPRILQRFDIAHGFYHAIKGCIRLLTIAKPRR